jgi:hypothetical protein
MKVYLGCGLTHVPRAAFEKYVAFIHRLASALRAGGCEEVTYALMNSDPQLAEKPFGERARLCYVWDRDLVEKADVLVAEASYPSTGLGIEMQIAENRDKPIVVCFRATADNRVAQVEYENPDHSHHALQIGEGYVSLMALGIPSVFRVVRYDQDDDGIAQVLKAISSLKRDDT